VENRDPPSGIASGRRSGFGGRGGARGDQVYAGERGIGSAVKPSPQGFSFCRRWPQVPVVGLRFPCHLLTMSSWFEI